LVGWRGMVGSVLMDRMQAEGDFGLIEPLFFSTSNAGGAAPAMAKNETTLQDAHDLAALRRHGWTHGLADTHDHRPHAPVRALERRRARRCAPCCAPYR
jgi:aspartate-semialdehyde dehydrogenase